MKISNPFFSSNYNRNLFSVDIKNSDKEFNDIRVSRPDYCPFDMKSSYFKKIYVSPLEEKSSRHYVDWGAEQESYRTFHFGILYECELCHRYCVIDYSIWELQPHKVAQVINYDYNFKGYKYPFSSQQDKEIKQVSPQFKQIYIDTSKAEMSGLYTIVTMGYRRALEALIKGLLINVFGYKKAIRQSLGNNIKLLKKLNNNAYENEAYDAQLASWIGNDGTHFVKLNPDLTLKDLKHILNELASIIAFEVLTGKNSKYIKHHTKK